MFISVWLLTQVQNKFLKQIHVQLSTKPEGRESQMGT